MGMIKWPEGNIHFALSGGRTSAYMLRLMLDDPGWNDDVKIVFCNTGREAPETLDFLAEIEHRWGVDINWLEYGYEGKPIVREVNRETASLDGAPFATLIERKRALPNARQRWCTQELKARTAKRWLVAQGWKKWHSALGIRGDETRRERHGERERSTPWYPLMQLHKTRGDVWNFWGQQPFDLGLEIVAGGTYRGNCDGCFLKSDYHMAKLSVENPEAYEWWVGKERERNLTGVKKRTGEPWRFNPRRDLIALQSATKEFGLQLGIGV